MGYENGKTYWIVPQNNTSVALSVYGNTQVSQNRNVIVWNKQSVADQLWRVDVDSGYARIKSMIPDPAHNNVVCNYALNIWLGSSNYGNCDIHTWSDNLEDSKINFRTVNASQNLYLIQCYRNNADNNLYLTAESTASGANVKWTGRNTGLNQVWKLIEKTSSGGNDEHLIQMPYNYNQKDGPSKGFRAAGCACTCGMDVASFYSGKPYSFADFREHYDDYSNADEPYIIYKWTTPGGYKFEEDKTPSGMNEANTIAYIKRYIDQGIPPICHCLPVSLSQHWVVPFRYESGSGWDSIWVLDPNEGKERRMSEAMDLSCGGTSGGVDRIKHHPNYSLK